MTKTAETSPTLHAREKGYRIGIDHILCNRSPILIAFFGVFMTLAAGCLMMVRYRYAIDNAIINNSPLWSRFERHNVFIMIVLATISLLGSLSILYRLRKAGTISGSLPAAGSNLAVSDVPLDHISAQEATQLQNQLTDLLQALHRLINDLGFGAVFHVDKNNRVCRVNPLAQLLFLEAGQNRVLGQPLDEILAVSGTPNNHALIKLLMQSSQDHEPIEGAGIKLSLPHGRLLPARIQTSFMGPEEEQCMVVSLLADDLININTLRTKVERAARFLKLGSLAAGLAHEIRNPLASVAGLVEILREETEPDNEYRLEFIAQIEQSCDRLNKLLENLMSISSLEKFEMVEIAAENIVQEAVRFKSFEAKSAHQALVVKCDANLPLIRANSEWLERALSNVISNAFDETPEFGVITIAVQIADMLDNTGLSTAPYLDISIHNTGSYIAPERQDSIFDPFVTGKPNGTGLGLCIVQQILHAHGGMVLLDSDPELGTCFTLRLPVSTRAF